MFNLDDYETVAERVKRLKDAFPNSRVLSRVISLNHEKGEILAEASIYLESSEPIATDYAFGIASTYPVSMRKFYVEDTITSAIGRAISLVIPTDKKPTREDMVKVQAHNEVKAKVEEVKAKMADTSKEYVPVAKADDPWTTWESPAPQTMESAVEMVKSVLGGTTEKDVQRCKHGDMIWKTGTSKAGNRPWGHWRCSAQVTSGTSAGADDKCEPIWYEIKPDGTWGKRDN